MVKIKIVPDMRKEMERSNKVIAKVCKGDIKIRERLIVFTPESFASTFSPQRIKLLIVARKGVNSIRELAEKLDRPYEAVHRDVRFLEGLRLLETERLEKVRGIVGQKIEAVLV